MHSRWALLAGESRGLVLGKRLLHLLRHLAKGQHRPAIRGKLQLQQSTTAKGMGARVSCWAPQKQRYTCT